MTNKVTITIDDKVYSVEPGHYTLSELISHTGISKDTSAVSLETPDKMYLAGQSFPIQGGEVLESTQVPAETCPTCGGTGVVAKPAASAPQVIDLSQPISGTFTGSSESPTPFASPVSTLEANLKHCQDVANQARAKFKASPTASNESAKTAADAAVTKAINELAAAQKK